MKSKAVIVGTARTPFGRLGGALASLSATTLGAVAIRAALERAGVAPGDVEHVIFGQVLQAGVGQAPVRQAMFKAGLAKTVTGETVNKVCASGMLAAVSAARLVSDDDAAVVVAGGMESMSNTPYLLPGARNGYRFGDSTVVDGLLYDGLTDVYLAITMAAAGAKVADEFALTREAQDAFALQSHERATAAAKDGRLRREIVPLRVHEKQRDRVVVDALPSVAVARGASDHVAPDGMQVDYKKHMPFVEGEHPSRLVEFDEPVRADASLASMAKLRPLDPGGTITAGNAPGVNDGAVALVITSAEWAREHEITPLAELVDHATIGWDPPYLALTPAMAAQKLLDRHHLRASDIHIWEINEAFSAVALTSAARLGIDASAINALGGAVAFGHPLGASGARIVASVAHQLHARGGGLGIAAICSGSGQGDAVLVRVAGA